MSAGARLAGVTIAALAAAMLVSSRAGFARPAEAPTSSAALRPSTLTRARLIMGTTCTLTAEGADSAQVARALDDAFARIQRLDRVLSVWREDSELTRLNRAPGHARIEVSTELFDVLRHALAIAAETGGAFDPTIEPLNRAWDLRGGGRLPATGELADARARVGWQRVGIEPGSRSVWFEGEGMALDFGGIGKGCALDEAEATLRAAGIERAILNLGGEVMTLGDRERWNVQIAHPSDRMRPVATLSLGTGAVSTSGQSERGFEAGGRRYGHVLDPRNGTPVETPATVTVVTRHGARADALATALLVMGREAAQRYAAEHPDIGVLWLEPNGASVRAWNWNLAGVSPADGARLRWMN